LKHIEHNDRFLDLISTDKKYTYEEGKAMFFPNLLKTLMKKFRDAQHEALRDGYVDVEPKDGKRTGGFSSSQFIWISSLHSF